jgi:hypothetical protein
MGSFFMLDVSLTLSFYLRQVARESGGSNTSSEEPIEIPPPRPKRKPMHPYPRKLAHPLERDLLILENPLRSSSPNFSISEQENQSPTSVLSAVGSDALGSTDSDMPSHSLSPVSSAGGVRHVDSSPEDNGSPSPPTASSAPDEQFPKVLANPFKGNQVFTLLLMSKSSQVVLNVFFYFL